MKSIFLPCLALLLTLTSTTLTQQNQHPSLTCREDLRSRTLQNLVISADGFWMAAEELRGRDEVDVRVWSTESDRTFTIKRGRDPHISRDSRWLSALQRSPVENSGTANPPGKRAG